MKNKRRDKEKKVIVCSQYNIMGTIRDLVYCIDRGPCICIRGSEKQFYSINLN